MSARAPAPPAAVVVVDGGDAAAHAPPPTSTTLCEDAGAPGAAPAAAASAAAVASPSSGAADDDDGGGGGGKGAKPHPDDVVRAPSWGPLRVFLHFLVYGCTAFGGPVAQINMMRHEFVEERGWVTPTRFNRVFALYQMLPGPEATELACWWGTLAGGRLGGLAAGLGFILPGFLLMLLFAWSYERWGMSSAVYNSVFLGLQPAVAAMVFRAAHKIGEGAFLDPLTKGFDWRLGLVGFLAAFESVISVNFFITKVHCAIVYYCLLKLPAPRWRAAAAFWTLAPLAVFIGVIVGTGRRLDDLLPMGMGVARGLGNSYAAHFVIGLVGGLVTFGGAYTAIPFIQYECVTSGGFIANSVFLDSLAVCSILPTPMVMFVTMVGYSSGLRMDGGSEASGVVGAVLMTLGMFTPAFAMPLLFHAPLERLVGTRGTLARVLDSVTATVVGLIAVTAVQLLRTAVTKPLDAVIFYGALRVLYGVKHKYAPVLMVACAAMAGQVLFYPY